MHTSAGAACGRDDDDGADAPELCVRASLPTSKIEEIFACVNSGLEATTTSPILLFDSVSRPAPVNMEWNKTEGKQSWQRSEEHTSELQSRLHLVCRLLLEKKNKPLTYHSLC